jgi:hypothetical protein
MPVPMTKQPELPRIVRPVEESGVLLPLRIAKRIGEFLDDKLTGNITINVRDGEVLGAQIEEKVKV